MYILSDQFVRFIVSKAANRNQFDILGWWPKLPPIKVILTNSRLQNVDNADFKSMFGKNL